jgi:hypothetical protein
MKLPDLEAVAGFTGEIIPPPRNFSASKFDEIEVCFTNRLARKNQFKNNRKIQR